ncbi:phosphodiesterase [Rhabdaerophilum calidifontis]|uniref:phosphodiesterase n=1 Tax=Rhabdaerophilum calidifontis TaxID=2604328 RepID=UPI0012385D1B|nr:phosphodiesterase [Rhabdaerophilum calidifontis]
MKLIHLTDTHLVLPGQMLYGLDPAARLAAAIADINAQHADADLCVVTGDLTHWGEPEAYALFRERMADLRVPHVAMVGNHDRREACLAALPTAPQDANGFVQGFRDSPAGRLIFLDTLDEDHHGGRLCRLRLDWLAGALESSGRDQPLLLFMHHPPFEVGVHEMDRIALAEREALLDLLRPYLGRVRHLFFGHVHRPISGSWHGIPFSTLRGTNHQVWLDLRPDCPHLASHEPPAYAVVLARGATLVVHTHDFLDRSPRFLFSKPGADNRAYQLGPLEPVA